jgi:streptogramin lyase
MRGDSVFLATERGVIAGSLSSNLQDFNNWKRFDAGNFNTGITAITTVDEIVFAAINDDGIYSFDGGKWTRQDYLLGGTYITLNESANSLIVVQPDSLWRITNNTPESITGPGIVKPKFAVTDALGKFWIGDGTNGLISDAAGPFTSFLPDSPASEETKSISYQEGKIVKVSGGYDDAGAPLRRPGVVDIFEEGNWTTTYATASDITGIAGGGSDETFLSSFGYGIEVLNSDGSRIILDESNSPLMNLNAPERFVNITAIAHTPEGLWVANYGTEKPLHLLRPDNTWESFSFPTPASRFPLKLVVDPAGSVWMLNDPKHGGGVTVFNKERNVSTYLTEAAGQGGMPSRNAASIAIDRDGFIWVGTDRGVSYYIDPVSVFTKPVDVIKPIIDGRFLLRDDKVTAIAVDGGNRKWFGTDRGAWLYGPAGDVVLENLTVANSPLPSNRIVDVAVNDRSGEVFFATVEGLASYRSGATKAQPTDQSVKIFPNPVLATFAGTVGISGTPVDAVIKITDITGKLVWETRSNGGTATWNLQSSNGRRVPTGVYIVFTVSQDGDEKIASKIAVVD